MNSAEQTVTWLITLGVLESPKKTISDPEAFLQSSLKDGVVLCRLLERLSPGSTEKVRALNPPLPAPPPHTTNRPPRRRVCALQIRENRRGLLSGFSFCSLAHEAIFLCRSRQPGLLSAKTALYAYTDVRQEGGVSTAYWSGLNQATAHRIGNWVIKLIRHYHVQRVILLKAWSNLMQMCSHFYDPSTHLFLILR